MVNQIWEPGLAWVEVVPGGSGERMGRGGGMSGLLPEGVETGLGAEVFGLFARGEYAVYARAHGIVGEPGIGEGLAEFVDLGGESRYVCGCDLGGRAPVLGEEHVRRGDEIRGRNIPLRDGMNDGRCQVVRGVKWTALALHGGRTVSERLFGDCKARASF